MGRDLNQKLRDVLFELKSVDSDYCLFFDLLRKTETERREFNWMILTLYNLHYIAIEPEYMTRFGERIRLFHEFPDDALLQITYAGECALEEYDRNKALTDKSIKREKLTLKCALTSMIASLIGIVLSIISIIK